MACLGFRRVSIRPIRLLRNPSNTVSVMLLNIFPWFNLFSVIRNRVCLSSLFQVRITLFVSIVASPAACGLFHRRTSCEFKVYFRQSRLLPICSLLTSRFIPFRHPKRLICLVYLFSEGQPAQVTGVKLKTNTKFSTYQVLTSKSIKSNFITVLSQSSLIIHPLVKLILSPQQSH